MIWLGVALMVSLFLNTCLAGGVIVMVIQLARLMNPKLYRRQAISNSVGNVATPGKPLKVNAKDLLKEYGVGNDELDNKIAEFVQTP